MHQDSVHRTFDIGDEPIRRYQCRVDAQFNAIGSAARNTEQLDSIPQLLRITDIGRLQSRDPFHIRLVELNGNAKGNRRHQRCLMRRIDAFDIKGRVGFGIAESLRFLEHDIKVQTFVTHL